MRFAASGPALAIAGAAGLVAIGCTASGTRPASSFTALDRAMKQARTWVDTTVEQSSGSPSWSLFAGHDGFKGEISGNRVDSSIRISINTPCFDTRT